jgi:predicted esterase
MSFEYIEQGEGETTVFVLHFMTGTKDSMGFLLESDGLRLIYPQGKYPSGHEFGGQSWFRGELDLYEWSLEKQGAAILETTHELAAFMRDLAPTGKRIVTGMSQGGDLTLMLAAHYPEWVDVAIPAAGRLFPPANFDAAGRTLPTVYIQQGEIDDTVPLQFGRDAQAWLTANQFEATLSVYPDVGHDYSEDMIMTIRKLVAEHAT